VLHLFGGPFVTVEQRRFDVPEGSKRLLVFVALHRGRVDRRYAAGSLWPGGNDLRAAGNLRLALWRLNGAGIRLLSADKHGLTMRDNVLVDAQLVASWAARLLADSASDRRAPRGRRVDLTALRSPREAGHDGSPDAGSGDARPNLRPHCDHGARDGQGRMSDSEL
jgi:DNA-binding SARP family transcriptional activator